MSWIRRVVHRLRQALRGVPVERELDEEVREYVRLLTEEKLAAGMRPADARRAALLETGGVEQVKEGVRSLRAGQAIEVVGRDLRMGFRSLMRTPGFTITALVALALGAGASTAVFSVVDAVLLRPLAYDEPGNLVVLLHDGEKPVAAANYVDWKAESRSFEGMGAAEYWNADLTGQERPERLRGLRLTLEVLPLLGVQPLLGRMLASEGEVVLSHAFWRRRWAGDPGVVGRVIRLNGLPYTVVGVMPDGFDFAPFWATDRDVWTTLSLAGRETDRGGQSLRVIARLAPGVTLGEARAEVAAITARLEQAYPATNRDVVVTPLTDMVVRGVRPALLVLMGAVALLLMIACANVAHMMLARATTKSREVNVRSALGAGRGRIILQFMTESLVLAVGGCSLGLGLAVVATRVLRTLGAASIPRIGDVVLDARAVGFAIGISLLTGIVFGLAPLFQVSSGSPAAALHDASRGSSAGGRLSRMRHVLVATEFALALLLLTGAGLLLRSFVALQAYDPGFASDHVLSMVVSVQGSAESSPGRRATFYHDLLERVRRVPGVESAGAINHLPLAGDIWGLSFFIEGRPRPQPGEKPNATYRVVMPGYFETMRLPLLRGRAIDATDDERSTGVVVINESLADRWWPGEEVMGQRISFADPAGTPRWLTVVGVTKNAVTDAWGAEPGPELYLPMPQVADYMTSGAPHFAYVTLVVRASGDPAGLAPAIRDIVWSFDSQLPISEEQTMTHVVAEATAQPRFNAVLLASFAAIALCIAAVGIYGVMSYVVSRRTREIGIRIALGAKEAQIIGLVVGQGVLTAAVGALVGLAGALLSRRVMASLLYGIGPADPLTFTLVPLVLTVVAAMASWVPVRRALAMNPVSALHDE